MNQRGLTLLRILLIVFVVGVLLAAVFLFVTREQARARDAKRIADMARLQAAFELLFADRATYADAAQGCPQAGSPASACTLTTYLPTIAQLIDPSGGQYLVTVVPSKDAYGVGFTLERSYDGLKKGEHTLSQAGIQ